MGGGVVLSDLLSTNLQKSTVGSQGGVVARRATEGRYVSCDVTTGGAIEATPL